MPFISNGTTILDNGAFSVSLGNQILISEQTASASASISFTTGIDSTYPIYKFEFINMHPATDGGQLSFNMSTDSGSNYNVTKTSTAFQSIHNEAGNSTSLNYETAEDLAQGTGFQDFAVNIGNGNDENASGEMYLFNPSSTTFVKHFITDVNTHHNSDYSVRFFTAGYGNTTSSINAVRFQMSSGNIDSGTIKLYGIKDS
jgi:hypothetical protein